MACGIHWLSRVVKVAVVGFYSEVHGLASSSIIAFFFALFDRDVFEWGDKVMTSNAGLFQYFVWAFVSHYLLIEGIW